MNNGGLFITFEGTDGVGKSTQLQLASSWLKQQDLNVLVTREPGGSRTAEKIRKIVLDPSVKIEDLTELFLYQAARIEHVVKIIKPALNKGQIVLCDRFTDSTLAYQGVGRNLMESAILLNNIATAGLKPDLTILLSLAPELGYRKALKRSSANGGDRLENEGLDFQRKVHQGFLAIAKKEPRRVKVVPVQGTISETQKIIRSLIQKKLHENSRSTTGASIPF